jgi:putative FmdB family regulatory protein
MPIYEYQCAACDAAMEKLQKISDEPLVDCPACGKPELRKLVSAAGFRLKGGGWYETDFKSGSKKNLAEGGSSTDAEKGAASSAAKSA